MSRLFVLLTISLFVIGCSNKELTRSKARDVLEDYYQFPNVYPVGVLKEVLPGLLSGTSKALINRGYITYSKRSHNPYYDLFSTEESKPYFIKRDVYTLDFFACDVVFNEISGIKLDESGKKATVYYSLKLTNINPIGEIYEFEEGQIIEKVTLFELYDDGWRIRETEERKFIPKKELTGE